MAPSSAQQLVPDLEDLRNQMEKIVADARQLTANVSESQFNWRPQPGKWSMAQCLCHLNLNGGEVVPKIDACIREAREKGLLSKGPYGRTYTGRFFLWFIEPPPKKKVPAPKAIVPPPAASPAKVVPEFFALQDRLIERLQQANGIDLGRAKMASPVSTLLTLTLGESLALAIAHERRHLQQAWQVRNDPGFPAG